MDHKHHGGFKSASILIFIYFVVHPGVNGRTSSHYSLQSAGMLIVSIIHVSTE